MDITNKKDPNKVGLEFYLDLKGFVTLDILTHNI